MSTLSRARRTAALLFLLAAGAGTATPAGDGFEPIFDGKSLAGWETPDPAFWSVEDGAITGRIEPGRPAPRNLYLVLARGELADFELKLRSRVRGEGAINNGFQFRSRLLPDHDVCGYQVDNNLQTPWLVRLYDEYGRHGLAERGERTTISPTGERSVERLEEGAGDPWFRLEDWHEYHLTCRGPLISLRVDGRLASEVLDGDESRRELQGILALQLHTGPPTVVQFKDLSLHILSAAVNPVVVEPVGALALRERLAREASAWWTLDVGGHGARPALRHHPEFYEFELNVKATGPGATQGARVAVLAGAYFAAEDRVQPGEKAFTVYLRARDPSGAWKAALVSAPGNTGAHRLRLSGADVPGAPGPALSLEISTDRGTAGVTFSLSPLEAAAWHDLVGRYDGSRLELFCDGARRAEQAWTGALTRGRGPLVLGAELEAGKPERRFQGELEVLALWDRALPDVAVAALSGK